MNKFSLQFIAPRQENIYKQQRLPSLLRFFKMIYLVLILINLIFSIGISVIKSEISISNSFGLIISLILICQYTFVIYWKQQYVVQFLSLTNIEIASIHFLKYVGFTLYTTPEQGFAHGIEFMYMHMILLLSNNYIENSLTFGISISIHLIVISLNGFCFDIIIIFTISIVYIYQLHSVEIQQRIGYLYAQKDKQWNSIIDLASQPYILCSFNEDRFAIEPNKINIAGQDLFQINENNFSFVLRSIHIENQFGKASVKLRLQSQNLYDHLYEKYLNLKSSKDFSFELIDEEFQVSFRRGEKQLQISARIHSFYSFQLIFAIIFTDSQAVEFNENATQLRKKHTLLQKLISGSLKTLQKQKKLLPKKSKLNWNILYATNQILNINYYIKNKIETHLSKFCLKQLLNRMTEDLNEFCHKKQISLCLDMNEIQINNDKILVTHLLLNFVILIMRLAPKRSQIKLALLKTKESEGHWEFSNGCVEVVQIEIYWIQIFEDQFRLLTSQKNQLHFEIIEKILEVIGPTDQINTEEFQQSLNETKIKFRIYADLRILNEYKSFHQIKFQ